MATSDRKINFAGLGFNGNHHLCAFFHSEEEELRAVLPFLVDGLAAGEKVIFFAHANMVDDLLNAARNHGYRRTRVVGDMDWASENHIPDAYLIALEARLDAIYSRHDVWVICAYDLSHFSGVAVLDCMRTHPATLI